MRHLRNGGTVDDAAEDVDQDALNLGVRVKDLERGHHLRGGGYRG